MLLGSPIATIAPLPPESSVITRSTSDSPYITGSLRGCDSLAVCHVVESAWTFWIDTGNSWRDYPYYIPILGST